MTISSKLTIFYNNQLVNFRCCICGGYVDPCGFDFGLIGEVPEHEPNFVCHQCTEYLRPDLVQIQKAGFKFANSGLAQGSGDTGKSVEGTSSSMPWQDGYKPAAPAASALPNDKEYLAEKHAHERRLESELLVRSLVEDRIKRERLRRSEDLLEGIEDANRQGMSLKEIEMLEFHRDNYCISLSTEGPTGLLF
jgi:hypothetical protein